MSKHTPTLPWYGSLHLPWYGSLHPTKSPKVGYNLHDNSGNPGKIRILTNDIAVAYYVADACNARDDLVEFVRDCTLANLPGPIADRARALLAELEVGHD